MRSNIRVLRLYTTLDFTGIFHLLGEYISADLSSFYLDIIKDRLYVEKVDGQKRRSAQTACWYILDTLTRLIAPILSFTAEQLSDHYQKNKTESIHLQQFASLDTLRPLCDINTEAQQEINALWTTLKAMRSAMLKSIEQLREQGTVRHSLEAQLMFYVDANSTTATQLKAFVLRLALKNQLPEEFFKEFLIVSQVHIAKEKQSNMQQTAVEGLYVHAAPAEGVKCPRCWQWQATSSSDQLCMRCFLIVDKK